MRPTLASRLIGAALLFPALLVWLLALVIPALRLVVMSLQNGRLIALTRRDPQFVGFDNYQAALNNGVVEAILYGVSLAILPLLIFFLVGPLMGLAASHSPALARRIVRVLLVLPLAAFAPAAAAFAWLALSPPSSRGRGMVALYELASLTAAVFGLVCVIAVTIYSSALRRTGQPRWPAVLAVSGIALLAGLAIGIQQFGVDQLAAAREVMTPETLMYRQAFQLFRLGPGAAVATIELVVLAILGVLAACIVIFSGLRIQVTAGTGESRPGTPAATIGLVAGAVVILGLSLLFLLPWIAGLDNTARGRIASVDFLAAWVAPLISTVFAVILAALGGYGIGALRPLGKRSELLLLPFAPWLFTGTGPFAIPAFATIVANQQVGSFWAKIPPLWTFVPALFLFTLLFRGQRKILPVLPAAALTIIGFWILQAQDFLWSLLMSTPRSSTAPAAFLRNAIVDAYQGGGENVAYSTVTPLWFIAIVVIGAALVQWFYADRIVLTTSEASTAGPPVDPSPQVVPPSG
jgi:ABC-type sugar transport system permease subunit